MAFVNLFPTDGGQSHPIPEKFKRLRGEFAVVDTDPARGREHMQSTIAATLRFSDILPRKQPQLARLRAAQNVAVYLTFGDSRDTTAGCCFVPDSEFFFGFPNEVDGPARPLVERCASALGYELFRG
jgi:hypothetical protein